MNVYATIFLTVFLAEIGDKTQLATVLFASEGGSNRYFVFIAASAALVLSTAFAVALGAAGEKYLTMLPLKLLAGLGFIAIGAFMIFGHFKAA